MTQDSPNPSLSVLASELATAANSDTIDREEFKELFNRAVIALQLSTDDLEKLYHRPRFVVEKWLSGQGPHRVGRSSVILVLHKAAHDKALQQAIDQAERGETRPRPDNSRYEYWKNQPSGE